MLVGIYADIRTYILLINRPIFADISVRISVSGRYGYQKSQKFPTQISVRGYPDTADTYSLEALLQIHMISSTSLRYQVSSLASLTFSTATQQCINSRTPASRQLCLPACLVVQISTNWCCRSVIPKMLASMPRSALPTFPTNEFLFMQFFVLLGGVVAHFDKIPLLGNGPSKLPTIHGLIATKVTVSFAVLVHCRTIDKSRNQS